LSYAAIAVLGVQIYASFGTEQILFRKTQKKFNFGHN